MLASALFIERRADMLTISSSSSFQGYICIHEVIFSRDILQQKYHCNFCEAAFSNALARMRFILNQAFFEENCFENCSWCALSPVKIIAVFLNNPPYVFLNIFTRF